MDKSEYIRMYALETNFWWYRVLHELVESVIQKYKGKGPINILDAGCGTGRMMEISQKYGSVYGIDYSPDAVTYARKRGLENIELGDLNDVRLEDSTYDVIISLDVLYHSAIKDDKAIVDKFYHSLKEGGILIINLPAFEYLKRSHDIVVHTKKRYRRKPLEKDLEKIGFTILRSSYRMPLLYLVILIAKLLRSGNKTSNNPCESESDLKELPGWLNSLLFNLGRLENWWLKQGFRFPVGSSLFIVARKTRD